MRFIHAAAFVAATALAAGATAQEFPTKPIRIIVPSSAGTGTDILMRTMATRLQERRGWTVVVENRPGGDFIPGILAVSQGPSDGHTILQGFLSFTILPHTKKELSWDLFRDLAPVARVATIPVILVAHPSVPARTLQELIAWSKANPGKLTTAGTGSGTASQLGAELMKLRLGLNTTYVPYKDSVTHNIDLFEGRVLTASSAISEFLPHVQAGKVRAIVALSPTRSTSFPDLPTALEVTGNPEIDASSWMGFFAHAKTSPALIARLEKELIELSSLPEIRDYMTKTGQEPLRTMEGAEAFRKRIQFDYDRWGKVIKDAGLKFD